MDDFLQPSAAPRPRLGEALIKTLGKNLPRATFIAAAEAPDLQLNPNPPPVGWEIVQAPFIAAMDLRRHSPAHRAGGRSRWRSRDSDKHVTSVLYLFDNQAIGHQRLPTISETHVHPRATSWVPCILTALYPLRLHQI
jgi:hypothetical protein